MVERRRAGNDGISETILGPAHRSAENWLTGLLLGFSWRSRKAYASQCIWKRLRASTNLRQALARCGAFALDSRALDPVFTEYLSRPNHHGAINPMIPVDD